MLEGKKGDWFSKDEANLIHERGVNGAVWAGVSSTLWFVTVKVLISEVCICSLGVWPIYKPRFCFTSSGLRCGRASSQSWRGGEVGGEERCWVSQWHWGKNLVTLERGGRRLQRGEVHSSERSKARWASTLNQTKAALTRRVKDATRNQRIRNKLTWVSSRQLSRWLTWRLTADRRCWYASPVRCKCKN